MPIRPEFKKFYGREWRALRLILIAQADGKCRDCGEPHPMLNVAHLRHDPRDWMLRVLCPSCHATNDAQHNFAIRRRNWSRRHGQLWLTSELEFAPVPAWLAPRRVEREAQLALF